MGEKKKRFYIKREVLVPMVEALQRSEPGSDEIIRNTFRDKIFGHIVKRAGSEKIADELLDEVFSEILGSINKLRKPEAFVTWCNIITEHQIAAYYRRYRRTLKAEREHQERLENQTRDAENTRRVLAELVQTLPKRQAEVVKLHYIGGYSVQETAKKLGVPEGTVKSRLYYARKAMMEKRNKS